MPPFEDIKVLSALRTSFQEAAALGAASASWPTPFQGFSFWVCEMSVYLARIQV